MPARLAQFLVSRMLLTQERAGEVLRQHQTLGGQVDSVLLEQGVASEADVLAMLGEVSGFMPVNLMDFEPNPEVASFIPPKIAERLCVVPLSLDGNTLHVASGYPVPKKELDEVGFLLGKPLELWVATEVRVREWVSTIYRQPLAPRFAKLAAALDPEAQAATPPPPPAAAMEEESLTADMVERLARSVAQEPLAVETSAAPQAAAPRPEAPASPQRPPPPPPEALTPGPEPLPPPGPPAFVRAPLRLNMPQAEAPARPAQRPNPQAAQIPVLPFTPASGTAPSSANTPTPASPPAATLPPRAPATAPAPKPATPSTPPAPTGARAPAQSGTAAPASGQPQVWPPAQAGASGTPQVWPPAPAQPTAPPTLHFATPVAPPPKPAAAPRSEPAFLVFPNPGAAQNAPPPRPKPAALAIRPSAPPASQDVPDWTLAQARAALKEATKDRDRLIDVALRFGRRTFDYVASFAVLRGGATGLEARGEGMAGEQLTQVSIPLDASSVFRTVAVTRGSYAGPLPPDALTRHYLELFGRQTPRTVFLYPVEVKGRLVAILYGDCGQRPISQRRLSDYILFCQDLPAAFQELILFRKQRVSELRAPDEMELTIDVDLPVAPAPAPAPAVVAGLGWSPFFGRGATGNMGRAAALPPRAQSQEERPPPDFAPLLRRLTGPDAAQRANAMAELARSPEASARVLAQHFPGPTAWSRLPVVELPEADELGPIPGAMSRLGRPAAQAVSPLLDSQDADTRYFALLTAGNLPYVELVDGVLRGLFDLEPDISSAARVAAAALKQLPRLDAALRDLRHELNSRDPLRRSLAARALGTLHDRDAIEGLIRLTGGDDEMCAQAAAEALREVTRATLGLDPRPWSAWWAENRSRRRADWLVSALRHRELDVRLAAIEELSRALHDTLGYYADAPEAEREQAVRRWEAAAVEPANARRLGML
ncbi:FrgA protein [Myxococcus xanthus]|uniref:GspE/PulE/PilB domain-containing protein n=1 Tax=Myxococcus xanthus TaxID=34 RepID=UPI00112E7B3C|nr:FrgA protein [Myxococcus xanthus]QDF02711.1 FrgA protein [Myxococcus xanthus]